MSEMIITYKTLDRIYLREKPLGRSVNIYEYNIKNDYVDLQLKGADWI